MTHPANPWLMARLTSFLRSVGVLTLCLLTSGCTHLYFLALNGNAGKTQPSSMQPLRGSALGVDIYPAANGDRAAPVLIFFYGGRWQDGKREDYAFVGRKLAAEGLLVMVPDYRLYPEVRFPAFVEDAAAMAAWAKAHAAEFGGDPNRIFLAGHSAGAHMVALLGTDARYFAAHGLQPRDFAGQRESQPVNFADGDEPPFLLLHGGSDLLVWPRNSQHLQARLQAAGSAVSYIEYPGVGHIRILASLRYPGLAPTQQDMLSFIADQTHAASNSAASDSAERSAH